MEELAKLAGGKGDVVILEGQVTNEAAVLRTQGCNDVVGKNPGMKVVATQAGDWDRAKGQSITENWIQSGILKAGMVVCANNDEMALGAINALKAGDLLDTVFVGGVDATSEALAAMQAGDLEVTVFQDAEGQGKGGVDAAVDLVARQDRPQQPASTSRTCSSHRRTCSSTSAPTSANQGETAGTAGRRRNRVLPFGGPARWASEHRIRARVTRSFRRPLHGSSGSTVRQEMGEDVLLRMTGISKSFPGVQALDDVHLDVEAGTVHALMGENGAGKSTLMKVLAGIYRADAGTIELDGAEVQIPDSATALRLGIAMIHQELSPVPEMPVAENIYLGREPLNRFRLVDKKLMVADARALFAKWQIDVNPRRVMKTLSVAQMQMVEIAKAISYDSRLDHHGRAHVGHHRARGRPPPPDDPLAARERRRGHLHHPQDGRGVQDRGQGHRVPRRASTSRRCPHPSSTARSSSR